MSPRPRRNEDALAREYRRALGRALGILRRRRRKKPEEVAQACGVHLTTYSLWERGEVEPTIEHLRDALSAMEYDFHDLQDVLDTVENHPGEPEPAEAPEYSEEERLVRQIVTSLGELFDLRRKAMEARKG